MQCRYKYLAWSAIFAASIAWQISAVQAATFNYHGNLQDSGKPAEGAYDLELTLYSASAGGQVIGGPLSLFKVPLHGGAFNVDADFGPLTNPVGPAWLSVKVRTAGQGEFAALPNRALVSVEAASVCPGAWTLAGNAGNPAGSYLGTADTQPLVLKMNAAQVANFAGATGTVNSSTVTGTNVLFGDPNNSIAAGVVGATVAGGGTFAGFDYPQIVGPGAQWATIAGGIHHTVNGYTATVGGGDTNSALDLNSTVSGGVGNTASIFASTVSGGANNTASGFVSTIAGGSSNIASGDYSMVSGGISNSAIGQSSTVAGGDFNVAQADYSTVAGGGHNQAGGNASFAAGFEAHVRNATEAGSPYGDEGTFVWSDASSNVNFSSTGLNQFLIRSVGGVAINGAPVSSNVELTIVGNGNLSNNYSNIFLRQSGVAAGYLVSAGEATGSNNNAAFYIDQYDGTNQTRRLSLAANGDLVVSAGAFKPGGGSWAASSDARLKTNVQPLDHPLDRLLQLRGVSFEYLRPDDGMHPAGRHDGFIAQEVQRVFPEWVGTTPDGYLAVGPSGFEALSVEAFRQLREEKDAEIADLNVRLDDLAARLARLEAAKGH